jgi:Ser/Thr protein kinase RdoA (MazF antagonist)
MMKTNYDEEHLLAACLTRHFQIYPRHIVRINGHSNSNYQIIDRKGQHYILRYSRKNRSKNSVDQENLVLNYLKNSEITYFPHLVAWMVEPITGRFIHLFDMIPGDVICLWWQQCRYTHLTQIFTHLALLHQAMAKIPLQSKNIKQNHCVLKSAPPAIIEETTTGQYVVQNWAVFCKNASLLLSDIEMAFPWEKAHYQWIHGDVHLENILFDSDQLTAFLDFEFTAWDACEKDVIFSAFRLCKEGNTDQPFQYDEDRFQYAINCYQRKTCRLTADFFRDYQSLWKPYFCLNQSMLYIQNAFDGVWQLQKNTGFLPCFNEVLHYR